MKVWITRPYCVELCMGGLRSVDVWVEKPFFDQRPLTYDFDLYCSDTNTHFAEVYQEQGWYTPSGSCRAKRFLKQDESILQQVWALIQDSLAPLDSAYQNAQPPTYGEYDHLLDPTYEMKCRIHWKRFLLELDLRKETVRVVQAEVLLVDGQPRGNYPITPETGTTSLFLDEDIAKPFWYEKYDGYEIRRGERL
ncbi:hypothetical protein RBE51_22070 [Pseudomonas taiwanensis]|uniref:hypothetical protein n=1 Tax=Pseudomonas taiwanensis TaxID=470150 RepID=UPI0028DDF6BB|nr:hypothetical protein [Pseudomonas taiwanensis]MDT8925474.1 hypothetical protein [Pseudomonas taiwanensis]